MTKVFTERVGVRFNADETQLLQELAETWGSRSAVIREAIRLLAEQHEAISTLSEVSRHDGT